MQTYSDEWTQDLPHLSNPFLSDTTLLDILETRLSKEVWRDVQQPLTNFGKRCITEIKDLGFQAEKQEPQLHQYDAWQNRIDTIETCGAWKRLHDISAEEGIVSIGYQRKPNKNNPKGYGQDSRLVQFAKLYLFAGNAAIFDCPLAMTDGAARLIEATLQSHHNLPNNVRHELEKAFDHLTSTNPSHFWTSGQWMTEKRGGSDVSQATRTIAIPSPNPTPSSDHLLRGVKFFTSATDSDMTFTLGRIVKQDSDLNNLDKIPLSLFFVRIRDDKGRLNGIEIRKLKDKLGTRALPTAELGLNNAKALLIGEPGKGVRNISYMLTITRTWNAVGACSGMRRIMALAQDYATRRKAFGKNIVDLPLHSRALARLETETRACVHFTFDIVDRMGKMEWSELGNTSIDENNSLMLRLMIPILKLYTARQAVAVVTEGIECIGGQGYIEDTGIPTILRNMHVLPIWEGTTNVLSMDVLRVLGKHSEALQVFAKEVSKMISIKSDRVRHLSEIDEKRLRFSTSRITSALKQLTGRIQSVLSRGTEMWQLLEVSVRDLSFSLAHVYVASLLLNHVMTSKSSKTNVSLDVQTLYQYMITHEPLCRFMLEEILDENNKTCVHDIIQAEKMIALDIGGSGQEGRKVDQVLFSPYAIRSSL